MILDLAATWFDTTNIDEYVLVVAGIALAVTAIAAAAHKTPLRQVGRWVGWVTKRLVGEPVALWFQRETTTRVTPVVRAELAEALAPLLAEQARAGDDRERIAEQLLAEQDLAREHREQIAEQQAELTAQLVEHMESETHAIEHVGERLDEQQRWREGPLRDWQDSVDMRLGNIEQAHVPHVPTAYVSDEPRGGALGG